ncbi:hypothetical protein [Spirosoma jeollabukense]
MVIVYFSGYDSLCDYHECTYGGKTIDSCFEMLSVLVRAGWKLVNVKLSDSPGCGTWLPIEAFDGKPLQRPLRLLQREWEEILFTSRQ